VWELPPSLAGDESTHAARMAVGESDRMTLKFVKPAS
jgi:predicted methyltransferase